MTPTPMPRPRGGQALPVGGAAAGGDPKAGSAGWKAFTEARWARKHPYAGQQGVDPVTGQPVMKSAHELRAESNAQAWKSIQQMQAALPSDESIARQYGGQRDSINALVGTHRAWLEGVGNYQTKTAGQLGDLVKAEDQGVNAQQTGASANADAGVGATFAGNIDPNAAAQGTAAYGGEYGAYLKSLIPSATAQGIGNIGIVNANENADMATLRGERAKIAGGLADLQQADYKDNYAQALDEYKSELAAIVAGQKGKTADAKLLEMERYHTGMLGLSEDRNTIARDNAQTAYQKMLNAEGGPNAVDKRPAGEAAALQKALHNADLIYHPKAGAAGPKVPTTWSTTLVKPAFQPPGSPTKIPEVDTLIEAPTKAEAEAKVKAFMADPKNKGYQNRKAVTGSNPEATAATVAPENVRRLHAWRQLTSANSLLSHPYSEAELLTAFRALVGKPKGAK